MLDPRHLPVPARAAGTTARKQDEAFAAQLAQRLPLASAAREAFAFCFDDALLHGIYDEHRGRCYQDVLTFPVLVRLVRDCLLQHGGSAHALFTELERDQAEPCDESNFYRKLARMPVNLARALLRRWVHHPPHATDPFTGRPASARLLRRL
jgi:hypothetical protein